MKNAPLLGSLRSKGGTILSFSTKNDDLSYLMSNSSIKVTPSHFALLELPDFENTTDQSIFFDGTNFNPQITNPNTVFPKVFQNYVENLLSYSEDNRTDSTLSTYAEQGFFKMLRLMGGLSLAQNGTTTINGNTHNTYIEDTSIVDYNPIVKYVGKSNMINHRKEDNGLEYVEFIMNVPTESGAMDIQFKPNVNVVHNTGLIPSGGGADITAGLDAYNGTDQVEAIYDTVGKEYEVGSDLTDVGIDFDTILNTPSMHNKGDYEFNAILIYYTIYDEDGNVDSSVNAWGLMLLEEFDTTVGGVGTIKKLKKYQPDNIQEGNSFNFKLRYNFGSNTFQIATTTNTDYSFNRYLEAVQSLNSLQGKYDSLLQEFSELQGFLEGLTGSIGNFKRVQDAIEQLEGMNERILKLESWQNAGENIRISGEDLMVLFTKTVNEIKNANGDVQVVNVISPQHFFGKLVDASNYIVEFGGKLYKWNFNTQQWELYTL